MTRVKICGITSVQDAAAAIDAGAHALGFVFAPSPRRIDPATAAKILATLPPLIRTVGVFVDPTREEIENLLTCAPVDLIQLHGDESAEFYRSLPRPVLKRLPVFPGDDPLALGARAAQHPHAALLVDPGAGDGDQFAYARARTLERPFLLAGGLHADNVAAAIDAARPQGVDVCSGVESRPGIKDPQRLAAFLRAVRRHDERNAA